jgi:hypothetical protein
VKRSSHLKTRKYLLFFFLIAVVILALTQLQPWVVARTGGVAGSFGVRSMTHACLGITNEDGMFPPGEMEFMFIRFHFRYSVSENPSRPLCVGQDIWYGE